MRIIKQKIVANYCLRHDVKRVPYKVGTFIFHFCPKCEEENEKAEQRYLERSKQP